MNRVEMREAEMAERAYQEMRLDETVETVLDAHSFLPDTSLKRGANEKNFNNLPRVFLRKKAEAKSTNQTKENRKDAQAAKRK